MRKSKSYYKHPTSIVEKGATIGKGSKIWHFSHVLKETVIGKDCVLGQNVMVGPQVSVGDNVKIQNNVSVYKGVTLEDGVFCGPSCVFTNVYNPRSFIKRMDEALPTLIKKGATIGANATIVCGNTIGKYAFIGAGSVVTRHIPDYALCYGNPAKINGWMCECGIKLTFKSNKASCEACGKTYEKAGSVIKSAGKARRRSK